ncbi:hypothetical protein FS749_002444, partial [Ceratobasidium sp. UAMH 11750]
MAQTRFPRPDPRLKPFADCLTNDHPTTMPFPLSLRLLVRPQTTSAMHCPPTPRRCRVHLRVRRPGGSGSARRCTSEQAAKVVGVEEDPSREPPARTLTWFATRVLRRTRASINVLQLALAYLVGAKPGMDNQVRIAADRQAELAIQIA